MADVSTTYHLQLDTRQGWVTLATAPTQSYPTESALIEFADRIIDNVHADGNVYDGGHRIIAVMTTVTWTAPSDADAAPVTGNPTHNGNTCTMTGMDVSECPCDYCETMGTNYNA